MKIQRKAGILLPISSLPSNFGIGTLGSGAYNFIDYLNRSNIRIWQILPLLPTGYGDSPYQSICANALNYYFIDFEILEKEGLLTKSDFESVKWFSDIRRIDYGVQFNEKIRVLKIAFSRFDVNDKSFKKFLNEGKYRDFALFMSLKIKFNYKHWREWEEYSTYDEKALAEFERNNLSEVLFWQFTQFEFLREWKKLKEYANSNCIEIMGDMPIYVAEDSVEMWKQGKELFMTDEEGKCTMVAGVPPDAFTSEGQLWGNPLYDYPKMKLNGYAWWKDRIKNAFKLYDIVRIDHFRGLDRFYAIKAGSVNAKEGVWLDGPRTELFEGFEKANIVAEDLGVIDDGVRKLMSDTGYPGMKVLMFAFDGNKDNLYKPSNYTTFNTVAYTGTHDNEPMRAYLENSDEFSVKRFKEDLKAECELLKVKYVGTSVENIIMSAIRLIIASSAERVIIPMHDVLNMGAEARINFPSSFSNNNWTFRYVKEDFTEASSNRLKTLVKKYHRN